MWFMIKVSFGEHDRCDDSIRPETRFVLRAISQKFSYSNFDNDMALLRLNDRVPITDHIRPICLPTNKGEKMMNLLLADSLTYSQTLITINHFVLLPAELYVGKTGIGKLCSQKKITLSGLLR